MKRSITAKRHVLSLCLAVASGCASADFGPGSLSASRHERGCRQLARDVDAEVARNALRSLRESVECDGGALRMQATLFTNAAGKPRKYVLEGTSGQSSETVFYYYDASGILRLIDADQRGAGNAQRTTHVYFDSRGNYLEKRERASGPKQAFSTPSERRDPESDLRSLADPDFGCRSVRASR